MTSIAPIPAIERKTPGVWLYLAVIPFFLIIVPSDWLLKKLGLRAGLLHWAGKSSKAEAVRERMSKVFAGYVPGRSDVFVSTFMKSGTNWMMQIAHQVAFKGRGEYEHIHDAVSWPDGEHGRPATTVVPLRSDAIKRVSPTGLRVIKTHLAASYVPYNEQASYLVVVRDPKEVFVSSYHFMRDPAGPLMPALDRWLDLFLSQDFPINYGHTWAEHTASYWALRHQPNVLILSYSKMKQNLAAAVEQVAATLNVRLTPEELASVVERSSFEYMKTINHKFVPGKLPWTKGCNMMRAGEAGNSGELLSLQQQQRIDEHMQKELKNLGSDFPYAEFCRISMNTMQSATSTTATTVPLNPVS